MLCVLNGKCRAGARFEMAHPNRAVGFAKRGVHNSVYSTFRENYMFGYLPPCVSPFRV